MDPQELMQKDIKTHEKYVARQQHERLEWTACEDSAQAEAVESALALLPKKMRRRAKVKVENVSGRPPNHVRLKLILPNGGTVDVVVEKQGDQWQFGSAYPYNDALARRTPMFYAINSRGYRFLCDQLWFAWAFAARDIQHAQGAQR